MHQSALVSALRLKPGQLVTYQPEHNLAIIRVTIVDDVIILRTQARLDVIGVTLHSWYVMTRESLGGLVAILALNGPLFNDNTERG